MEDSVLVPLLGKVLTPGVLGAVVGVVLSVIIEYLPGFEQQSPKKKRLWFFGACLVVSLGASVCIAAITGVWDYDPLIGNALVASIAASSVGTLAHGRTLPDS